MKHTEPEFRDCWIKYALVLTTVPQDDHLCKSEKNKKIDPQEHKRSGKAVSLEA